MAQVPTISKWIEAKPYLENLKGSVEADVRPLLSTSGGAPFAISREVLSYIDHLGHLYSGKKGVGKRSKEYLKKVLSRIDRNYDLRANEIYEMYRCGSVHEFEPKILINKGSQYLAWLCYGGRRMDTIGIERRQVSVTHLKPLSLNGTRHYWLPISTVCLIDDLIESIGIFINGGPEGERVLAWNNSAKELGSPVSFDFVVP